MKTLVADRFPESHLIRLREVGCELDYQPDARSEDLPALAASCRIMVVRSKKVTMETLQAGRQLALVLRAGAGVNTIDVKSASSQGIFVSNCPNKNSVAVAELVFALLLAIDRRIPDAASCRIQLGEEPSQALQATLREGNPDIIGLDVAQIG